MSRTINKITLVGNVGLEPEIVTMKDGQKVAHFSIATHRGDGSERTDWHRLTLYGRQAQFAEDYIRTSSRIYVEGRLEYDSYERDNVVIPTAEIAVSEVILLSPLHERTRDRRTDDGSGRAYIQKRERGERRVAV
jgi:single-strand DNA-binding protein